MSFQPIFCNSQTAFDGICKELNQLNAQGSRIAFQKEGKLYVPKAQSKSKWVVIRWMQRLLGLIPSASSVALYVEQFFAHPEHAKYIRGEHASILNQCISWIQEPKVKRSLENLYSIALQKTIEERKIKEVDQEIVQAITLQICSEVPHDKILLLCSDGHLIADAQLLHKVPFFRGLRNSQLAYEDSIKALEESISDFEQKIIEAKEALEICDKNLSAYLINEVREEKIVIMLQSELNDLDKCLLELENLRGYTSLLGLFQYVKKEISQREAVKWLEDKLKERRQAECPSKFEEDFLLQFEKEYIEPKIQGLLIHKSKVEHTVVCLQEHLKQWKKEKKKEQKNKSKLVERLTDLEEEKAFLMQRYAALMQQDSQRLTLSKQGPLSQERAYNFSDQSQGSVSIDTKTALNFLLCLENPEFIEQMTDKQELLNLYAFAHFLGLKAQKPKEQKKDWSDFLLLLEKFCEEQMKEHFARISKPFLFTGERENDQESCFESVRSKPLFREAKAAFTDLWKTAVHCLPEEMQNPKMQRTFIEFLKHRPIYLSEVIQLVNSPSIKEKPEEGEWNWNQLVEQNSNSSFGWIDFAIQMLISNAMKESFAVVSDLFCQIKSVIKQASLSEALVDNNEVEVIKGALRCCASKAPHLKKTVNELMEKLQDPWIKEFIQRNDHRLTEIEEKAKEVLSKAFLLNSDKEQIKHKYGPYWGKTIDTWHRICEGDNQNRDKDVKEAMKDYRERILFNHLNKKKGNLGNKSLLLVGNRIKREEWIELFGQEDIIALCNHIFQQRKKSLSQDSKKIDPQLEMLRRLLQQMGEQYLNLLYKEVWALTEDECKIIYRFFTYSSLYQTVKEENAAKSPAASNLHIEEMCAERLEALLSPEDALSILSVDFPEGSLLNKALDLVAEYFETLAKHPDFNSVCPHYKSLLQTKK